MKNFAVLALILSLSALGSAHATEAVRKSEDRTTGKSLGGMNGMLIGAGLGALFGGCAQEAAGLSERDYEGEGAGGERKVLRVPN